MLVVTLVFSCQMSTGANINGAGPTTLTAAHTRTYITESVTGIVYDSENK